MLFRFPDRSAFLLKSYCLQYAIKNLNISSFLSFSPDTSYKLVLTAYYGVRADLQGLCGAIIARKLRPKDHTTACGLLFVFLS